MEYNKMIWSDLMALATSRGILVPAKVTNEELWDLHKAYDVENLQQPEDIYVIRHLKDDGTYGVLKYFTHQCAMASTAMDRFMTKNNFIVDTTGVYEVRRLFLEHESAHMRFTVYKSGGTDKCYAKILTSY